MIIESAVQTLKSKALAAEPEEELEGGEESEALKESTADGEG